MREWFPFFPQLSRRSPQPETEPKCRHLDPVGHTLCLNRIDTTSSHYFCSQHLACRFKDCARPRVGANDFCEDHGNWATNDLETFRAIKESYLQDLREYWARSNFYLLINAGLLAAFSSTLGVIISNFFKSSNGTVSVPFSVKIVGLIFGIGLSTTGLCLVLIWLSVANSSLYWIKRWRERIIEIGPVIDRRNLYLTMANETLSERKIPTCITRTWLSLLFIVVWLFMLVAIIVLFFSL